MRAVALGLVASLLCGACDAATGDQRRATEPRAQSGDTLLLTMRCQQADAHQRCQLWAPSLIELIARPELYDGRRVRVMGFVNFEFEGNGLYLGREDWERSIIRNALWIDPPPGFESDSGAARASPNRRYVIVEATFNARHRGHLSMFSGALENVTRLDAWGDR